MSGIVVPRVSPGPGKPRRWRGLATCAATPRNSVRPPIFIATKFLDTLGHGRHDARTIGSVRRPRRIGTIRWRGAL